MNLGGGEMAGRFPYGVRYKYPHMLGEDVPVWGRFVSGFPGRFDSVDYDFRVGEGVRGDPAWDDATRRMAKMLSQKRIDVVGWNGDVATIIEVKDRGGLSAIGQLRGYRTLWNRDLPAFRDPDLLLVCGRISSDDLLAVGAEGIRVEVV